MDNTMPPASAAVFPVNSLELAAWDVLPPRDKCPRKGHARDCGDEERAD